MFDIVYKRRLQVEITAKIYQNIRTNRAHVQKHYKTIYYIQSVRMIFRTEISDKKVCAKR